jgi:hypothetical protein
LVQQEPANGKRDPRLVIVVFHTMTIAGESSQKISTIRETCFVKSWNLLCDFQKSTKDKSWRKLEKEETFVAVWKKTTGFDKKFPPIGVQFCSFHGVIQ